MRLVLKLGSDVYGLPSQETYLDSQDIHLDAAKIRTYPDICKFARKVSHEAEHYILEGVTMNNIQIPEDNSLESIKIREKIIRDFYREWKEQNPSQRKYNVSLKEYINIRMVSIVETSEHAAKTYLSTIAVLQLDAILTGARKVSIKKTKPGNKNQQPFERMMIMEYELAYIGKIKMTVGIRRRTHEKVQYCITAIQSI
jgi:hypothetical protein